GEEFVGEGGGKGGVRRCDPRLHVREAMVACGDNARQPDHQHVPQTQARPMAMGGAVCVDQLGHTHLQEKCDDDRDIICALVSDGDVFAHSTSFSQFLFSRENSCELYVLSHHSREEKGVTSASQWKVCVE